jgi:transposase-like protein
MTAKAFGSGVEQEVIDEYLAGASIKQIARTRRVSAASVHGVLKRHNTPRRSGKPTALFTDEQAQRLRHEYEDEGASLAELARRYDTTPPTILKTLRRVGTTMRRRGNSVREFSDAAVAQMAEMWRDGSSQTAIAQHFGSSQVTISRVLALHGVHVETRRPSGERHGWWKGGRHISQHGYTMVRADPTSKLERTMMSTSGYIAEHRLVMARSLNRSLSSREMVHHINGDKTDNRIENLQLRNGHHGKGQTFRCRTCGSHDVEPVELD